MPHSIRRICSVSIRAPRIRTGQIRRERYLSYQLYSQVQCLDHARLNPADLFSFNPRPAHSHGATG
ncbi:MAG: hypothetical protein GX456_18900 [Verrucomicrobia bacterium]|nr:hypothetical protein [Verrucomicrobiota bacterium]